MTWLYAVRVISPLLLVVFGIAFVGAFQSTRPNKPNRFTLEQKYKYGEESDRDSINVLSPRSTIQWGVLGIAAGKLPTARGRESNTLSNVHELRKAVLDDKIPFSQIEITSRLDAAMENKMDLNVLHNHAVLQIMKERFDSRSKPGHRSDNETVALAIEGGGMRGCVAAGMAAAIGSLGLSDTIDKIYGSSAGSVIGSYLVSRQMCVDVYVDILPAAKRLFVCKTRIVRGLAQSLVEVLRKTLRLKSGTDSSSSVRKPAPGMNISFVLDSIMGEVDGVRPLDLAKFKENNAHQQLRVVSSSIDEDGQLVAKCFGTEDFFGDDVTRRADGSRQGLFACLEASMTVPAATGPPVDLLRRNTKGTKIDDNHNSLPFFDAFCFEPLPYRSAVAEGATHVMVLASRPLGFQPATQPGVYERTLAPIYFYSHSQPEVARFFERGGQQYLYAEDILLLSEAKNKLKDPVLVAPPKIIYGLDDPNTVISQHDMDKREQDWKKAHLFPVQVPPEEAELGTLEQDKDAVLQAVRGGFSAAFDILAPIVGLQGISGQEASKLVFPDFNDDESSKVDATNDDRDALILATKITVPGDSIVEEEKSSSKDGPLSSALRHTLLSALPGFQRGKLYHLSRGLRHGSGNRIYSEYEQFNSRRDPN